MRIDETENSKSMHEDGTEILSKGPHARNLTKGCLVAERTLTKLISVSARRVLPRWPGGFKASVLGAEDLGFESPLPRDFSGSSHTSDLKIGIPVATLPGAWH